MLVSFKYETNGDYQTIYKKWDINPYKVISLHTDPDGYLHATIAENDQAAAVATAISTSPLINGEIYHIAFVYEHASAIHLYINGQLDTTVATDVAINTGTPRYEGNIGISNYNFAFGFPFNSWIANLKRYDRALGADEATVAYDEHQMRFTGEPGETIEDPAEPPVDEPEGPTTAICDEVDEPSRVSLVGEWTLAGDAFDTSDA